MSLKTPEYAIEESSMTVCRGPILSLLKQTQEIRGPTERLLCSVQFYPIVSNVLPFC